jgi:asparagine synthetase B (glutamine-hydrolysing)
MKDSRWYCCRFESGGADSSSVAAIVGAMCTVSQSNEPFAVVLILYSS